MVIITKVWHLKGIARLSNSLICCHFRIVEITLKGQVNPVTGMVINLVDLKKCIQLAVMDPLDHRNLVSAQYIKENRTRKRLYISNCNNNGKGIGILRACC
jgi:6-pyruvoyl-tetrahydropterin synthase